MMNPSPAQPAPPGSGLSDFAYAAEELTSTGKRASDILFF